MGRVEDHKNYRKVIQNERERNLLEDMTTVEQKFVDLLEEMETTQDVEKIMELSEAAKTFVEAIGEERAEEVAEVVNCSSTFQTL